MLGGGKMTPWNAGLGKRLGVTKTGLRVLSMAVAGAPGAGAGHSASGARRKLVLDGHLIELPGEPSSGWGSSFMITDKGLGVVRRARAIGW